jgi:subtilisin family serine protease
MAYGKNKIGARIENFAPWMQVLTARMLVIVAAMLTLGASWSSTSVAQPVSPPVSTSSLIVKLAPGLSASEQVAVITRNGGVQTASVPALRLHTIQVDVDQLDAIAANYRADSQVLRVELNNVRQSNAIPSDPFYSQQWALPRIGWDLVFGTSNPVGTVVVAVLDTGIDATHPDLTANLVVGTSILDGSNGFTDPSGHGTMVAGAVAARTNSMPAEGIAGVAYAGVRLMPVTVLDADGLGQDSNVIEGVIWAADHGAHVIVMAFSNPGFSDSLQEAIDYAWSKNVVLVAATGNDGLGTPTYPAGDRGVIGVSATDENDELASFSNYGPSVFLAAPGTNILTTDIGSSYIAISGTSTSAALVAGAAAQMLAIDPTLTNGVVVGRLARTADPAGTQEETGNGRVNLARALLDTGTDFLQPAGAAPMGSGGPFVGPYRAAAVSTTTTVASNQNPSNVGQLVTFTATVACGSTCTFAAGSTVDFKDGANNGCNGGTTLATVSTLTGSGLSRQATFSTSSLAAGAHPIRACFNNGGSGTGTNAGSSSSGPLSQVVNGVAATTLNVSAASGTYGGTTTLSATLMSGGTGVSGKTISFTLNGGAAGSTTTNASGVATLSNVNLGTTLNAAAYPTGVGASFAGDLNFSPSNGTAQLTVSQASSSTTVTCPSTSVPYSAAAQTPCTVSVTGAGGLNLTPTPTYSNNTNAGTATASYTYAGDSNYMGSNDSNTFTIAKANTATTVTSSVNPSNAGSSVTFTAGVSSVAGAVSGTVQFVVDGSNSGTPVALVNGQATLSTSALTSAKTYTVGANYIGDTNFNPSAGSLTGGQVVVAGPLDHLAVNPASATITAGGSQSYTAEGFDAFGNSRGDVTAATVFSITDGSCAAASCSATLAGDHTVTGNDTGKTGTATLSVLAGPLKTFLVEAAAVVRFSRKQPARRSTCASRRATSSTIR